jgi:hypothetical protein
MYLKKILKHVLKILSLLVLRLSVHHAVATAAPKSQRSSLSPAVGSIIL